MAHTKCEGFAPKLQAEIGTSAAMCEMGHSSVLMVSRWFPTSINGHAQLARMGKSRLKRAPALQIGRGGTHHDASVGSGMVELFQHETDGRQVAFLDRAIIVAFEC